MSFQVGDVPPMVRSTVNVLSSASCGLLIVPSATVPAVMPIGADSTGSGRLQSNAFEPADHP